MRAIPRGLGVYRYNLYDLMLPSPPIAETEKDDDELLSGICSIADSRAAYGYRRVTALVGRQAEAPVNYKHIYYRIMKKNGLLLQRYDRRLMRTHEGKTLRGALVSFAFGFGTCPLISANLLLRIPLPEWASVAQVPKRLWVGDVFGVIFITVSIFLIPILGTATFLSSVVAGQLIGSIFIDHIGFLGLVARPIDRWRILGVILIVLGVYFIRKVR